MSKIDFSGIKDWKPEEQKEAKDLILEYGSLFALKDMDLGRTDKVGKGDELPISCFEQVAAGLQGPRGM